MNRIYWLTNLILLFISPTFLAYPSNPIPIELVKSRRLHENFKKRENYHLLTYDQILKLLEDVESGRAKKKYKKDRDHRRIDRFLAFLAEEGVFSDCKQAYALDHEIHQLLEEDIVLCGWMSDSWKKTKRFVKRHKKEIIIGAAIVAAVAVTAIAASTLAASAAAGAACAKKHSPKQNLLTEIEEKAPIVAEAIEETVSCFKEIASADPYFQNISVERDPTFFNRARELGSMLAHEAFEEVANLASVVPECMEGLRSMGQNLLPNQEKNPFIQPTKPFYEELVVKGHQAIDRLFCTDQTDLSYFEQSPDFAVGVLPPPFGFTRGLTPAKFRKMLEKGGESISYAQEMGLTTKEISQLEKVGKLENAIGETYQNLVHGPATAESIARFKNAQAMLKPHKGINMSEASARELLHKAGMRTFPRPKGIPDNFRVKLSDKPGGMKYVHPHDEGTYVRLMPGKPHSPNPNQQHPYINYRLRGQSVDKFGNLVSNKSPEAHIPLDQFIYREL